MRSTVIRVVFAVSTAIGVRTVMAQEFGEEGTSVPAAETAETAEVVATATPESFEQVSDGGIAADQKVVEEDVKEVPKSATEQLSLYVEEKGYMLGTWDETKDRIVVQETVKFDIANPEVSSEYIKLRAEKMSELLLNAKAQIISTIFSSMSAERSLDIPGNPIAKQVAVENEKVERQLKASRRQLERLGAHLDEATAAKNGMTTSEWMASISAWFTSADKENLAAKYDADKKELYANAKADFERAKDEYDSMLEKADKIKGRIAKTLKSRIGLLSSMQIHGCTVLQQADSVTEKNGRYQYEISILYSWSGERMAASQAILAAKPVKFKAGKNTVQKWLGNKKRSGALGDWIGPRSYIDKDGNIWFIGIAVAPCSDNADQEEENLKIARLEARAEIGYAIYADASTKQDVEKLMQGKDTKGLGVADEYKVFKAYSEQTMERFENLQLFGCGKLGEYKVKDATGQDIYAVVFGMNATNAKAMKDIHRKMHQAGLEINAQQEFERGRQQRMQQQMRQSRNDATARAAGARQADKETHEAVAKKRAATKRAAGTNVAPTTSEATQTKGRLQSGTRFIADEDDE